MSKEAIVKKITEIAERVAEPEGIEIVEVQLLGGGKARLLRIFIDKIEGVSHKECEFISQQVGTILDVEDVIPGDSYTLEVSSPGVERPLTSAKHFRRARGRKIDLALSDGSRLTGRVGETRGDTIALVVRAGRDWAVREIPLAGIVKAVVQVEFSPPAPAELELATMGQA